MRVTKDFFFGIERVFEHHYFERIEDVALEHEPRSILVCMDAGRTPFDRLKPLAHRLLDSGGVFFCCYGYAAKMTHDAVDWVRAELDIHEYELGAKRESDARIIMTTWHDDELLEQTVEFWCQYGYPPADWGPVRTWTSVTIGDELSYRKIQAYTSTRKLTDIELGRVPVDD